MEFTHVNIWSFLINKSFILTKQREKKKRRKGNPILEMPIFDNVDGKTWKMTEKEFWCQWGSNRSRSSGSNQKSPVKPSRELIYRREVSRLRKMAVSVGNRWAWRWRVKWPGIPRECVPGTAVSYRTWPAPTATPLQFKINIIIRGWSPVRCRNPPSHLKSSCWLSHLLLRPAIPYRFDSRVLIRRRYLHPPQLNSDGLIHC